VSGDFDNDGIQDLVVCNAVSESITLLRGGGLSGTGDGTFGIQQTLPLGSRPRHAVVADFNVDGRQDVAVSLSGPNGPVQVFLNDGNALQLSTTVPALGRTDGLAAADVTQDGILDLVVCLVDSAGMAHRGGIEILRGGGQGGTWDQTFTTALKAPTNPVVARSAYRAIVQDFNQDGILDIAYTRSPGAPVVLRFAAPLVSACAEFFGGAGGLYALTTGDFDGDGKPDLAYRDGSDLVTRRNQAGLPACADGFWFSTVGSTTPMPGPTREIAALDYDQDGILDLAATLDDFGTVQWLEGNGMGSVGDGTFQAPVQLTNADASGIAVGDFSTNGAPDLAIGQPNCDRILVLENPNPPNPAIGLTLVTPNGGEVWEQGGRTSLPETRVTWDADAADAADAGGSFLISLTRERQVGDTPPRLASIQQITWSKGAGIPSVDVQVSRDGGTTWQTLAARQPGNSLTWIVTPPGTPQARVRVLDSAIPSRLDGSDGSFDIPATPATGVPGGEEGPTIAAFSLRDANPVRGIARFAMDVPRATEARVQVFDVQGRVVRSLLRASIGAGRHELLWDTRDGRGVAVARGVYFIRARFDAFSAERKVVVLR
jgi:hypothetical protein